MYIQIWLKKNGLYQRYKILLKENNLTLDITYKETTDVEENIVLSQGRDPGDQFIMVILKK